MSIKQDTTKIKTFELGTLESKGNMRSNDLFIIVLILLVAFASFGLGRLSATTHDQEQHSITFESSEPATTHVAVQGATVKTPAPLEVSNTRGTIVASKNGTKYHFQWCSGAQRIKDENKIWFASEAEARKAGYEPASNCKGLK